LNAPPVGNAANEALVTFLAAQLNIPRRGVRIVSGLRSRSKRVLVVGMAAGIVRSVLS